MGLNPRFVSSGGPGMGPTVGPVGVPGYEGGNRRARSPKEKLQQQIEASDARMEMLNKECAVTAKGPGLGGLTKEADERAKAIDRDKALARLEEAEYRKKLEQKDAKLDVKAMVSASVEGRMHESALQRELSSNVAASNAATAAKEQRSQGTVAGSDGGREDAHASAGRDTNEPELETSDGGSGPSPAGNPTRITGPGPVPDARPLPKGGEAILEQSQKDTEAEFAG